MIAVVLRRDGAPVEPTEPAAMCAAASWPPKAGYRLEVRPGVALAACGEAAGLAAGPPEVLVAADARLDNRAELAAELGLPPASPGGDPALLLAGYRRWGEGLVDRLAGDFAFVVWDGVAGKLIGARDPLGMRSLHWARTGTTLRVSSEAQQQLACSGVDRRIDQRAIAEYLISFFSDPTRSFYAAVAAVPHGHLLVSTAGGERLSRYWRPEETEVQPMDLEEAGERFRRLLWRAVADRLVDGGNICGLLVSGGLDSSALAAVTSDLLAGEGNGRRLASFCFGFEELPGCDESAYWKPLATHLGIEIERIDGPSHGLLDRPLRQWPESPFVGWQPPTEEALVRLRLRRGRVLLTGLGADSVVAGSACVYADRLRQGRLDVWRELGEHARNRGGSTAGALRYWGLRPLLPRAVRRHLALCDGPGHYPEWIDPRWARRVGLDELCRERAREPRLRSRARRVISSRVDHLVAEQRAAHWYRRLAARHGIDVRHPFLDRRLAELVLATPPELLFRAGRYKRLLRWALAGRLPEVVRQRVGKTGYGPYLDLSWRRHGEQIRRLLRSPRLADLGVLRMDRLRPALEDYLAGRSIGLRSYLWAIITTELWLDRFADAVGGSLRLGPGSLSAEGRAS